jgi:hypothetical protein
VLPQSRLRNQVGACLSDIRQWGAPHLRNIGKRSHILPAILSPGSFLKMVIENRSLRRTARSPSQ